MAITQNFATSLSVDGAGSLSYAVSPNAGSDIAALIGISYEPLIEAAVSSVTFDAQSATFIQLVANLGGIVEQYYVKGVAVGGSRTLAVNWDGGVVGVVGIELMNGVDQTTPLGAIKTEANAVASTTAAATLATSTAGSWAVDTIAVHRPAPTAATPDVSQTSLWNSVGGVGAIRVVAAASQKLCAGGAHTMQYTLSPARRYSLAVAEFRATPDTGKPVNISTSYHYGADPLPLESFKDPAVQQRIWVNDRRHMQGDS